MNPRHSAAVCTVVTLNHAHFAVTLMESISACGWNVDKYVFLLDGEPELISAAACSSGFTVLGLDALFPVAPLTRLFRYSSFEMATSVKPDLVNHLMDRGYQKVIYLDADVFVLGAIDPILRSLDVHDGIVTPHIIEALGEEHHPGDLDILRAGTINTGFVALRRTERNAELLKWWSSKLAVQCLEVPREGLVADQKWLDLVPSLFPAIHIDRSPGFNVAYWNLPHREIENKGGAYFVNGTPLTFFHFSGTIPKDTTILSKYDGRYNVQGLPEHVKQLLTVYHSQLVANGLEDFAKIPYSYDLFEDGQTMIPDLVRRLYRENDFIRECFGDNPFDVRRDPGFCNTYNRRIFGDDSPVTLLAHEMYHGSEWLRDRFPLVPGFDERQFAEWFVSMAAQKYRLSPSFVDPVMDSLKSSRQPYVHRLAMNAIREATRGLVAAQTAAGPSEDSRASRPPTGSTGQNAPRWSDRLIRSFWENASSAVSYIRKIPLAKRIGKWVLKTGLATDVMPRVHNNLRQKYLRSEIPALTVVGWLKAETGLGESARSTIRAAAAAGIPVLPLNLKVKCEAEMLEPVPAHHSLPSSSSTPITVINVNGNIFPAVIHELDESFLRDRYNIAYWVWEAQKFPEAWFEYLPMLDEIWTPSTFSQEALSRETLVPVVRVPHNVDLEVPAGVTRNDMELPGDRIIFLHSTDFHSIPERKNPLAVLEAFRRAFGPHNRDVIMCMKLGHPEHRPDVMKAIDEYVESSDNVMVIKGTLSRPRMNALISCCDCFVSLHRSEGFGLSIAEAMSLGKPVIATGWSGNMDFMNIGNSYPVRYDMVELAMDVGPFKAGSLWAEPDLDHAAHLMSNVVGDPVRAQQAGERASRDIRRNFSPAAAGEVMLRRIRRIMQSP